MTTGNEAMVSEILTLFENRMNANRQIRTSAELQLENMQNTDSDAYIISLLTILRSCNSADHRMQSIVHIKHSFPKGILELDESALMMQDKVGSQSNVSQPNKITWNTLHENTKFALKNELLAVIESEEDVKLRGTVVSVYSMIIRNYLGTDDRADVQRRLFALFNNTREVAIVGGLMLLSSLVEEIVANDPAPVADALSRFFRSQSMDIKYHCAKLICSIVFMEKKQLWKRFQFLVPVMNETLMLSLQMPSREGEDYLCKYLVVLVDISETDPAFFAPNLGQVTQSLLTIARSQNCSDRIQQLALEVVLSMIEKKPKMCRNVPLLIDEVLNVLMEAVAAVNDDPDWHLVDKDIDELSDDEDTTRYEIAEGGLDRVAASLEPDFFMPKLYDLIVRYLQQSDWRHKQSALVAIAQTIEHVSETKTDFYSERIVQLCVPQLQDKHPRVRHAACQAIGQAATDLCPFLQDVYPHEILPGLIATLDDPVLKVQSHCARALRNFCDEVSKEDFRRYVDPLVDKLLKRITLNTPKSLLQSCVTTLAIVAAAADNEFCKYYPAVVPAMKSIVNHFNTDDDERLREKALEAITIIATAVGCDTFVQDMHEFMEAIIHLWNKEVDVCVDNNSADSDIGMEGPSEILNESLARMCKVLGSRFTRYASIVVPNIFRVLRQQPENVDFSSLAKAELAFGDFTDGKTTLTETMGQFSTLLLEVVLTLDNEFQPYIAECVNHCFLLMEFQYCEVIMENAMKILAECLKIARQVAERESPEQKAHAMTTIREWVNGIIDKTFQVLSDENEMIECAIEIPKGFALVLKKAGPDVVSLDKVDLLIKRLYAILSSRCKRDGMFSSDEPCDEDDAANIENDRYEEVEFGSSIVEIIAAIMEHHLDSFLTLGKQASIQLMSAYLTEPTAVNAQGGARISLLLASYLLDEFLTYPAQTFDIWSPFFPVIIQELRNPDSNICQVAAHSIMLVAKSQRMPTGTSVTCTREILKVLEIFASKEQPLQCNDQNCYDNLVAALGALTFYMTNELSVAGDTELSSEHLMRVWLHHLPLKADDQEAQWVHSDLVNLVLMRNQTIMGPDLCNLPHLIKIFATIYKTTLANNETNENLMIVARSLDANHLQSVKSLTKEQNKNLEKLFSDARATVH